MSRIEQSTDAGISADMVVVLTDEEIERIIDSTETDLRIVHGDVRFDPNTFALECFRYARDNGYLAPAQPSQTGRNLHSEVSTMDMLFALHKVIAEFRDKRQHGDLFFQPLGGQAERLAQLHDELDAWLKTAPAQPPAPTVDIDRVMEVVKQHRRWIAHSPLNPPFERDIDADLRARLTKLMQP